MGPLTFSHQQLPSTRVNGMFAGMGVAGAGVMTRPAPTLGWHVGGTPSAMMMGGGALQRVVPEGVGKASCGAQSKMPFGKDGNEPITVEGCGCGGGCGASAQKNELVLSGANRWRNDTQNEDCACTLAPGMHPPMVLESERSSVPVHDLVAVGVPSSQGWHGQSHDQQTSAAAPPPSSSAGNTCEGWSDEGFFCAYTNTKDFADLEDSDIEILRLAYDLINDNIDYVSDYYTRHTDGMSSHCHVTRLSGGDWVYPKSMIDETLTNTSWNATNLWGSRYMLIDRALLQGAFNDYKAASSESVRTCIIMSIACLLVHETAHSCWLGENFAALVGYYFGRRFVNDRGLGSVKQCCSNPLSKGYDESSYSGLVRDDPDYLQVQDDGKNPLGVACFGP